MLRKKGTTIQLNDDDVLDLKKEEAARAVDQLQNVQQQTKSKQERIGLVQQQQQQQQRSDGASNIVASSSSNQQ